MDTILLSSKPIEISEYKTYKEATFMISVLDEWDLNGRMITKEAGEKYHKTIIGFPIVAKLIRDREGNPVDFRGHEMKIIQNEAGRQPWIVVGLQKVSSAVSPNLTPLEVNITLIGFTLIYAILAVVAVKVGFKFVKKGLTSEGGVN